MSFTNIIFFLIIYSFDPTSRNVRISSTSKHICTKMFVKVEKSY